MAHRAELRDPEGLAAIADPLLAEEDRPRRIEADDQRDDQQEGREQRAEHGRREQIDHPPDAKIGHERDQRAQAVLRQMLDLDPAGNALRAICLTWKTAMPPDRAFGEERFPFGRDFGAQIGDQDVVARFQLRLAHPFPLHAARLGQHGHVAERDHADAHRAGALGDDVDRPEPGHAKEEAAEERAAAIVEAEEEEERQRDRVADQERGHHIIVGPHPREDRDVLEEVEAQDDRADHADAALIDQRNRYLFRGQTQHRDRQGGRDQQTAAELDPRSGSTAAVWGLLYPGQPAASSDSSFFMFLRTVPGRSSTSLSSKERGRTASRRVA